MKTKTNRLVAVILLLFTVSHIYANPIAQRYFNELYFNSEGWELELCLNYPDSISLENWFMVSGNDTAFFKSNIYLTDLSVIVITINDLTGYLDLNPAGDSLELYPSPDFPIDFLYFGTPGHAAPSLNQSLCRYSGTYDFYLDNSPTIGLPNDSTGATGHIHGYIKDLNDKPAVNVEVIYDDYNMVGKRVYTDSTGHFSIPNAYAKNTQLYISHNTLPAVYAHVNVYPGQIHNVEIKLNWIITSINNNFPEPGDYILKQNYPNPFNPVTTISFFIPNNGNVELKVFDELGKEVTTLINGYLTGGEHRINFDGSIYPSGNYFYRLKTESFTETKKFTLIK